MSVLTPTYLAELTGLDASVFTEQILDLAEARATQMIGYLEAEEKVKTVYVFTSSKFLDIDETFTEVTKVEYRTTSGDFTEVADGAWRAIPQKKMVILDAAMADDTEVQVTLSIGWEADSIPDLVKFFLCLVTLDTLNKFKPGSYTTNEISEKKIGDYDIKYKVSTDVGSTESIEKSINSLLVLIKQGSSEPTARA